MSMFILAAALAFAPEPAAAPIPPSDQAPIVAATSIEPSTDTRRVCVVDTFTGSSIERKVCQTRATWVAQGIDPLAKR